VKLADIDGRDDDILIAIRVYNKKSSFENGEVEQKLL